MLKPLSCAAILALATLLSACASSPTAPSTASPSPALNTTTPPNPTVLVPFASDEGLARLSRSRFRSNFATLANQFEAQYNVAFCGPTSATIVLNAMERRRDVLPRDTVRLQAGDLRSLPAGLNPIIPRYTQDSVIAKGPKTRAQVLGEPVTINGKTIKDYGYQLRQLAALLQAHGVTTDLVIADADRTEASIRSDLSALLARNDRYVLVSYSREAVGQKGGGHISPLAAYDEASDSFLVLDVNPAVSGWVWMPAPALVKAMRTFDTVENRGYVVVRSD